MGSLQLFIEKRRESGVKTRTINHGLKIVRRILNLAASEWMDEFGLTWLASAPKIKLLPEDDNREPFPLNWNEERKLFSELPSHLREMCLFKVNTGCRTKEVCNLKWDWELKVPNVGSVFILPKAIVKNRYDRLVVLNKIAYEVIERQRGKHPEFVFVYNGRPIRRILNTGWKAARKRANLSKVRAHDLISILSIKDCVQQVFRLKTGKIY
jgi:integrase